MFKVLVSALVLLIGLVAANSQTTPVGPCPVVGITTPYGKNTSEGDTHYIATTLKGTSPDFDFDSLKYKWILPNGFPFEGQGKPYISFIVTKAMDDKEVSVSLEVYGLPVDCPRTASATFSIGINPGSPIILDDYENLPIDKERTRLARVVVQLKKFKGAKAIIFINYKRTDSEKNVKTRVARIISVLSGIHKLPLDSLAFVFGETGLPNTRIYAWRREWPAGVYSATNYQEFKVKR